MTDSSFINKAFPIISLRGVPVLIDADLAKLDGVTTKALNQAVRRNASRFPSDFYFQLSAKEKEEVVTNCDHLEKSRFSKSLGRLPETPAAPLATHRPAPQTNWLPETLQKKEMKNLFPGTGFVPPPVIQ